MKIVLVHNIYFPEGSGGAEHVVRKQAESLYADGHDVTIMVPGTSDTMRQEAGITILRVAIPHLFPYTALQAHTFLLRLLWHALDLVNVPAELKIRKALIALHPDKVICHNLQGVGYRTPRALRSLKVPWELYLHDIQLAIPSGILIYGEEYRWVNSGIAQRAYAAMVRFCIGSPDLVISPTKWLANFYTSKGFFKHAIMRIHEKALSKNASSIKQKLMIFEEKKNKNQELRFIYLGKIDEYKGILWLVRLWKKLPKRYSIDIYGKGTRESELLELIQGMPNISFHGYCDPSVAIEKLQKVDMLIMPSLCYENRPEVILDAYEAGTPVIASKIGGIPEIVLEEYGYCFEPGNETELISLLTHT